MRHSEVLPFRARTWRVRTSTLALLTSLKTGPLRIRSRHRRLGEAFRIQLIASGCPALGGQNALGLHR